MYRECTGTGVEKFHMCENDPGLPHTAGLGKKLNFQRGNLYSAFSMNDSAVSGSAIIS